MIRWWYDDRINRYVVTSRTVHRAMTVDSSRRLVVTLSARCWPQCRTVRRHRVDFCRSSTRVWVPSTACRRMCDISPSPTSTPHPKSPSRTSAQVYLTPFLFRSLAVLDPRVGCTIDALSPFIPVVCNSDWLFDGESCPRLDVVHPGRAWPSSPACTWHCSLQYLFLQATALFTHFSMFLTPALTKPYTPTNIITPTVTTGNESVPKIIKVAL